MIISHRLWKSIQRALLAAGAVMVFVALGLVLAALLPSHLGYESLIVYGGSMAPFLRLGDVAVIQPVAPQDLRVGDVVTYKSPGSPRGLVTHRIIRIKALDGDLAFETKGDASPKVDYWSVTEDTVVGRVIYKVPLVGYVFDFAKGLPGRLLLVGLPALLLVIETSRPKHTDPSLNDAPTSKVQTLRQEMAPQAALEDAQALLVNKPEVLASPGGIAAQVRVVNQLSLVISTSVGNHQEPSLNDPRRDFSPTRWLHPVKLHPIEEKPPRLWVLGGLLLRQTTT